MAQPSSSPASKPRLKAASTKAPIAEPVKDDASHEVLVLFQMGSGAGATLNRSVVQDIINKLGGLSAPRKQGSTIDVWLESPGGDAHAAYKLGLYLRCRFEAVRFVIMDYAKSAATLLSLAGDEIFMAPAAELGPLDTQENKEGEIRLRSLLDTAGAVDSIYLQAVYNALEAGSVVLNQTGLTREKTIEHLLHFSGDFVRPLLEQIDPVAVNAASTSLAVATEYGARLLAYRNGRDGIAKARAQTDQLVRGYPTHGYVIDRDEARDVLDLPVLNVEQYPLLVLLESLYSSVQKAGVNVIRLFALSEVEALISEGGAQDAGEGSQSHGDR